jgi:hypothetical protein
MNRFENDAEPGWRRHLHALPEVEPPVALWPRLMTARAAPARAVMPRLGWIGLAVAAGVAMLWIWPMAGVQAWRSGPDPAAGMAPMQAAVAPGLRRLDEEISLAYARNADEGELASLWQARARLIAAPEDSVPALPMRM